MKKKLIVALSALLLLGVAYFGYQRMNKADNVEVQSDLRSFIHPAEYFNIEITEKTAS